MNLNASSWDIKIDTIDFNPEIGAVRNTKDINQSEESIEKLIKIFTQSGLSPSAMQKYLNCPLNYYYTYVLGLSDHQTTDEIDSAQMGSCIHDALEELYKPYVKQGALQLKDIANLKAKYKAVLADQFGKINLLDSVKSGVNHLLFLMSDEMVLKVLKYDEIRVKNGDEIQILDVEKDFESILTINRADSSPLEVKLRGKIDRIEKVNNVLHIMDYKSGIVDPRQYQLSAPIGMRQSSKIKSLQLLHYIWLSNNSDQYDPESELKCSIFSLAASNQQLISLILSRKDSIDADLQEEYMNQFEEYVTETIYSIMDREKVFAHNNKFQYCKYC